MQQTAEIIQLQTIHFDDFSVSLTNTNMYYVHVNCDVEITLDNAKQMVNAMHCLKQEKKLPTLILFDNFSTKKTIIANKTDSCKDAFWINLR